MKPIVLLISRGENIEFLTTQSMKIVGVEVAGIAQDFCKDYPVEREDLRCYGQYYLASNIQGSLVIRAMLGDTPLEYSFE